MVKVSGFVISVMVTKLAGSCSGFVISFVATVLVVLIPVSVWVCDFCQGFSSCDTVSGARDFCHGSYSCGAEKSCSS